MKISDLVIRMRLCWMLRPRNKERGDFFRNLVNEVVLTSSRKLLHYMPLVISIQNGNWKDAHEFVKNNTEALTSKITKEGDTALHLAVKTNKSDDFIMNLIKLMKNDALLMIDIHGKTALSLAVEEGNIEAVKALTAKQPDLPYVRCKEGNSPLQIAAEKGNRGIVSVLLHATKDHTGHSPYGQKEGQLLLKTLLDNKLYGAVAEVLHRHPKLIESPGFGSIYFLKFIGGHPSAFFSGCSFSLLQRILYFCVPTPHVPIFQANGLVADSLDLYIKCWIAVGELVPYIREIQEKKLMHQEAVKLVEWTCMQFTHVHYEKMKETFKRPLLSAAKHGIEEIVQKILDFFPVLIDNERIEILQSVFANRDTYILKLENHLSHFKQTATDYKDSEGNNILHLAAQFELANRNNFNHSAIFQILYELKWFKEMEKLVPLSYRAMKNNKGETPEMMFVEAHANLLSEGKRWLKETGTWCITVAAITGTFGFAAAVFVTINNIINDAYMFRRKAIRIFCFADALSLIFSTMSLFMCVLILMSGYTYRDFHHALPHRLTMGIAFLNLSIFSLIVALIAISYGTLKILVIMAVAVAYLVFVCINLPLAFSFRWPLLSKRLTGLY